MGMTGRIAFVIAIGTVSIAAAMELPSRNRDGRNSTEVKARILFVSRGSRLLTLVKLAFGEDRTI